MNKTQLEKKINNSHSCLNSVISGYARLHPNRVAINYYGYEITYEKLEIWTDSFAQSLLAMGIKKGDRISLYMENSPYYIIAMLGGWKAGAIMVPSNPMFLADELVYQLVDAGARVIITQDDIFPIFDKIKDKTFIEKVIVARHADFLPEEPALPLHPALTTSPVDTPGTIPFNSMLFNNTEGNNNFYIPDINDLALLQYTEGVTDVPMGAMLTHGNLMFNTKGSVWFNGRPGDRHLAVLPLFEITGLVHSMSMPLYTGGTIVLLARYDTDTVLKAIEKYSCTHWASITTMNIAVLNYPGVTKRDLTSLKVCLSGGAPLSQDIIENFQKITGANLVTGYGLIETTSQVTVNPLNKPRPESAGIPVEGTDVRVVDIGDREKELSLGEEGELLVKGPQVMKGYWNRPRETAQVLSGGWFATGDVVRMDAEGYIYVIGSKKELIYASGFKVFPKDVEKHMRSHPAVAEVAVVGVPDPYRVETVKAYIVLKRDYIDKVTEEDIIDWSRRKMAAYKYPRSVEFVSKLPCNGKGKVLRYCLKENKVI